jgi:hypothetical protein
MAKQNLLKKVVEGFGIAALAFLGNCASLQIKEVRKTPMWITQPPENCAVGYAPKSGNFAIDLERARFDGRKKLFYKLYPGKRSGELKAMQQGMHEDSSGIYVLMCQLK